MGEMGKATVKPHKQLINLIQQLSYRHSSWQVFSDFVEISAIAVSNTVDWVHWEDREKQYEETIKKYDQKEQSLFPQMIVHLVEALEDEIADGGPTDVLGQIFHDLELHNKYKGQFFTPPHICEMMGDMAISAQVKKEIKEKGFITLGEPAAGSGAMVLGFAKAMIKKKLNYCSQLAVTATDIDLKCVHMTYLQLSLYGIPAVVIHGNTLTVEEWSRWYTPVYILDGWLWRQQCGITDSRKQADERLKAIQVPLYGTVRETEALIAATTLPDEPKEYQQLSMFD
jgi:hypothetical protein